MTVTYTAKVATSSMGCFLKLLLRWKGSVYKLVWREFLIFLILYYTLAFIYRFALDETGKRRFEMVSRYCEAYNNLIPLAFVLGFYVSVVLTRWWEQFNKIPWPDNMALFITASVQSPHSTHYNSETSSRSSSTSSMEDTTKEGHDERGRLMRRTIMRYLCLAYVITLSSISPGVKKRFPTFQHMTDAGFMLDNEQKVLESVQTPHNKYFIPLVWSTSLVTRGRKEGRIKDDYAVKTLIDEINEFRGKLGSLFNYDWISLPLVYTQVVTLAVYTFFLSCLMGRQFVSPPNETLFDVYIPVFTFLQFLFYMGWLKVAETLVNPFGDDDDDFDINQVIDRNLQVSYLVVDEMHQEHPELIKDAYWDEVDFELPYTAAAEQYRTTSPFLGSAMDITLNQKQTEFVTLDSIAEKMNEEGELRTVYTGPTDIPRHTRRRSPFTKHRPLYNIFKRSTSRQTSSQMGDSDSAIGSTMHMRRQDSVTSRGSEDRAASPTITTVNQDDIFNMDDLDSRVFEGSDTEDQELKDLEDSVNSQTSAYWDALRARQMKELRKKEHRGNRHTARQELALLSDVQSTGRLDVTRDRTHKHADNDDGKKSASRVLDSTARDKAALVKRLDSDESKKAAKQSVLTPLVQNTNLPGGAPRKSSSEKKEPASMPLTPMDGDSREPARGLTGNTVSMSGLS